MSLLLLSVPHFLTLHPLNLVKEQSPPTSAAVGRLLRFGAVVLIVGAVLMLCASMAALYLWKFSDKNVSANCGSV